MARVYKNCSCFPARLTEDQPCEEAIRRQTVAAALGASFPVVLTVVLTHSKITRANANASAPPDEPSAATCQVSHLKSQEVPATVDS